MKNKQASNQLKQAHSSNRLDKENELLALTLRMLQPATVRVVEVATLKLLFTIVGHRHWDERVHAVEAPLESKAKDMTSLCRLWLLQVYSTHCVCVFWSAE